MSKPIRRKLNWLEEKLPEGLLVDAAWLGKHGFSTALRRKYIKASWLEQPARGVYRKPRGTLTWQQVIISLQTIILREAIIVGGRTALELQGFAHYLQQRTGTIHLYSAKPLPTWLNKLKLDVRFVHHNSRKLFDNDPITFGLSSLQFDILKTTGTSNDLLQRGLTFQPWGHWDWPLTLSTPERAVLELLDELPGHESFHQVDKLMEGLTNLSPRRLQKLLADCRSVKVKRLFFYFADRHRHAWLAQLEKDRLDLGSGKRMLVKGGRLDPTYLITVPEGMDGV
ncbi:MAG: type IV toxin-antitoxin system AbiEi family antitoxin domain-containing protein [Reyranella sp.]|nr:type IV toxin-antitoxin system AbiEi family antitoxin domain-containing protein [Reyranella sp.]